MVPRNVREQAIDATQELSFSVESLDVRGSVVADHCECAGAHALRRQVKGVVQAYVMRTRTFLVYNSGRVVRYQNPAALTRAIERFDGTAGMFPPGVYVLKPVTGKNRKGQRAITGHATKGHGKVHGQLKTRQRPMHALR